MWADWYQKIINYDVKTVSEISLAFGKIALPQLYCSYVSVLQYE